MALSKINKKFSYRTDDNDPKFSEVTVHLTEKRH